jgi:hypothetical protein
VSRLIAHTYEPGTSKFVDAGISPHPAHVHPMLARSTELAEYVQGGVPEGTGRPPGLDDGWQAALRASALESVSLG